jgi:hypothetical protein
MPSPKLVVLLEPVGLLSGVLVVERLSRLVFCCSAPGVVVHYEHLGLGSC